LAGFIGEEAIPELGIVPMGVTEGCDPLQPLFLRRTNRITQPPVIRSPGKL
jgi:hypothetical protein